MDRSLPTPLLFVATVLIWGSTFLVITFQLGEVAPAVSVIYRFGLGSLILFAWCLLRRERIWLGWRRQGWLILQGLLNFGLSYVCTYEAEGYLISALVAVLFALMVFWNALGARLLFGTTLTWQMLCAALVSIGGVGLLFSHSLQQVWQSVALGAAGTGSASGDGHFMLGLGLAVAATLSSSAGNMVAVKVGREHDNNVVVTTAWAMLWGMLSVTLWAILTGQSWTVPRAPVYWVAMLYLALCGSVIAFTAYFTLINRIGPGKAAYTGVMTPVVSVLLSMHFEGYQPGAVGLIGMGLCLAGVLWAVRSKGEKAPPGGCGSASATSPSDLSPATGDHA
ncbi:MAG: EamA family transporter [Herminiimonas sp.]|nr:EamA family transporter [Herminiimonas sp.]